MPSDPERDSRMAEPPHPGLVTARPERPRTGALNDREGESVNYQEAIAEFRRLDEEIEADQWRQAEIVYELVEQGFSRNQLAIDLTGNENNHGHVGRLYRTWKRFGRASALKSLPGHRKFAEAYRMVETATDDPDAASVIKNANRASSALGQLPTRSRAEIIREHLADPNVADEVMANREARNGAIAAVSRMQERDDIGRERPEPREPTTDPEQEMILTLVDFRRVQRVLTEITQRLQHSLLLRTNTDYQDAVLAQVAWDRNALDLIEIVANGGQTTDEELAQILEGS